MFARALRRTAIVSLVILGLSAPAVAASTETRVIDREADCPTYFVPEEVGIAGVNDDGRVISLELLVLLDGMKKADAVAVFDHVAKIYEAIDIDLVTSFKKLKPPPDVPPLTDPIDSQKLIDVSKAALGGQRPDGIDVVYTLTTREFTSFGAGQADCVSGVRHAELAFATGTHDEEERPPLGPLAPLQNLSAKIAGHEIGHLLGAHHEYGNCVERGDTDFGDDFGAECTIMFPDTFLISDRFGFLDASVVRGYALKYATP